MLCVCDVIFCHVISCHGKYLALDFLIIPLIHSLHMFFFTLSSNSLLARGTYNISGTYASSQTFQVNKTRELTEFVSLKILNNHGNSNYTCLYRLRVHGTAP